MQVVEPPRPMMDELRRRTASMLGAFVGRVPAAAGPIEAYLGDVKRG